MEQDYQQQINALREQMNAMESRFSAQLQDQLTQVSAAGAGAAGIPDLPPAPMQGGVHIMQHMHPDARLSGQMEELCRKTAEREVSGLVTYLGIYGAGGRQSNWIRNEVCTDGLLSLLESGVAGKVLACIGNKDRLAILLAILRGPKTVAQLVESGGFGSTGQVYHHMKPLLAADIIAEDTGRKGVYVIRPHKVQGVIMLLAGISDMVDETYTQGNWEPLSEEEPAEER